MVLSKLNGNPINIRNVSCGFMRDDSTVEKEHLRQLSASLKLSREQNYSPLYPIPKHRDGERGEKGEEEMGVTHKHSASR